MLRAFSRLCAGLLFLSTSAAAQDIVASDPPAHVSFVEGRAVLERDGQADPSPVNMPLLAGDRIRTEAGRVEILFGDGSTLHMDASTTVDFQSDELIRLLAGRIRLTIPGPDRSVSYRVDAPSAWVQINRPGEFRVALQRDEVELAVLRGAAELVNDAGRTPLRAGERAFSREGAAPSYAYVFNSASWDGFDRWAEARRDARLGVSGQYLPEPVRPYAASFDEYGSWRYESSYGYVWYPTVATSWRPYYNGRWITLRPYGWTWIGADPWGYATHHYGRWGVSAGVWFWIPGRSWAPAWVSWAYAPGYVSWCPLGWNNRPVVQIVNINVYGRGYDPWRAWTVVPQRHFGGGYVNVRGVAAGAIDVRTRGAFVGRNVGPEYRGYAVPRSAAPIRAAGTGAPSRGSSPVYTNLETGASRVGPGPSRTMVGPSRSAVAPSRSAVAPDASPRSSAGSVSPQRSRAVPRGATSEYGAPTAAAVPDARTPRASTAVPSGNGARTDRSSEPRYGAIDRPPTGPNGARTDRSSEPRYGVIDRTPTGRALPREERSYGTAAAPRVERYGGAVPPSYRTAEPAPERTVQGYPAGVPRSAAPRTEAPRGDAAPDRGPAGPRAVPRSAPENGPGPGARQGPSADRRAPAGAGAPAPAAAARPRGGRGGR